MLGGKRKDRLRDSGHYQCRRKHRRRSFEARNGQVGSRDQDGGVRARRLPWSDKCLTCSIVVDGRIAERMRKRAKCASWTRIHLSNLARTIKDSLGHLLTRSSLMDSMPARASSQLSWFPESNNSVSRIVLATTASAECWFMIDTSRLTSFPMKAFARRATREKAFRHLAAQRSKAAADWH